MRSKILHPIVLVSMVVATPIGAGIAPAVAQDCDLTPTDGYVPSSDERAPEQLSDWELARRIRAVGNLLDNGDGTIHGQDAHSVHEADLAEQKRREEKGICGPQVAQPSSAPEESEKKNNKNILGDLLDGVDVQIQIGGDNSGISIQSNQTLPPFDPRPVLADRRPSSDLNRQQLRERIALAQALAEDDRATDRQRNRLLRVVQRDQAELDRRRAEREAQSAFDPSPVLDDTRRARDLNNRQLRLRIARAEELRDSPFASDQQRRQLDEVISRDQAVLDRRVEARSVRDEEEEELGQQNAQGRTLVAHQDRVNEYLNFDRRPSRLTDAQLRRRIALADTLREDTRTTQRQSDLIRLKARAYLTELNSRISAATGQNNVDQNPNRLARRILRNAQDSQDMSDPELRKRIADIRSILPLVGLSDTMRKDLRALLADDRGELRDRVAQAQAQQQAAALSRERERERERRLAAAQKRDLQIRDLLLDDRAAARLSTPALRQRIKATVVALDLPNLTDSQQRRLNTLLRLDRQVLRERLAERRQDRERELRIGNFSITIDLDARPQRRSTIALAEVLDEELQEQLVAPPIDDIDEVYTLDDLREQPGLRNLMPGVEVDTVQFASGESVVREEEIPELERLGETIEQILNENPDEVFVIEGHTDLVGSQAFNLALSEDRAQAVRDALLDFFLIDEDALVAIGYGEQFPKIPTTESEQENRRVTVRRITPLIDQNYALR